MGHVICMQDVQFGGQTHGLAKTMLFVATPGNLLSDDLWPVPYKPATIMRLSRVVRMMLHVWALPSLPLAPEVNLVAVRGVLTPENRYRQFDLVFSRVTNAPQRL